jgi:hypothetical protein
MIRRTQSPAKQFHTPFDLVLADDFCRYPSGGVLAAGKLVEHSIFGLSTEGHVPERLQSLCGIVEIPKMVVTFSLFWL